jgi:hypothetical protein
MSNPTLGIASAIQDASINRNPSPTHDINPSTAASRKEPVEAVPSSDTASVSSDIVDPSRVVRPVPRRHHLPPLPDLRFEQSYLASLEGAESWQRIAWITARDQVREDSPLPLSIRINSSSPGGLSANMRPLGSSALDTRHAMDSGPHWLAVLEPQCSGSWQHPWKQATPMVVRGE